MTALEFSTATLSRAGGRTARWAHVGDSRLYHLRDGRIAAQTADHSVPQALVNAGEITTDAIRFHEDRNRLLRTLGNDREARPTINDTALALAPGDAFLLCTDGFWEYVTEPEMETTLARAATPDGWLLAITALILERAPPDPDNFSAVAVFVDGASPRESAGVQ